MEKTELVINGSKGKPVSLDITHLKTSSLKPIILFCHGFKGFKNWGHFDHIAERFADEGFVFAKFNFSFNGTTPEQPLDFADLEAFGNNNFSTELDDLGLVIDYMEANAEQYEGNAKELYLIGHSRGGGIAVLKTAEDTRIKKLATWAGIKDMADFFYLQDLEQWKKDGCIFTYNSRTLQNMPLNFQLYENYVANKARLDTQQAAGNIRIPWLIVHGTGDTSVPYTYAEQLHIWNPRSELFLIEHADHTFGGKHPWTATKLPEPSTILIDKTISFLKK